MNYSSLLSLSSSSSLYRFISLPFPVPPRSLSLSLLSSFFFLPFCFFICLFTFYQGRLFSLFSFSRSTNRSTYIKYSIIETPNHKLTASLKLLKHPTLLISNASKNHSPLFLMRHCVQLSKFLYMIRIV